MTRLGPNISRARDVRQLFVGRAGHCTHTAAEELTALRVLEDRISTGRWPSTDPRALNREAAGHGESFHSLYDWTVDHTGPSAPAFVKCTPGQFLR
ncbi:hypothetical protein FKR81_10660 [Lentzea tibetensis]|uniref:Uncharacterized protein n=1 Tax=Lentzea tibetensis TaxID=2591470 RepID=A0A563EWU6_9PSEU|nr:hypothetical protein [Lentzea tibetensis]TWP52042.1 hypothetical protein FKR81_10660 [Lentzea tibetensis]